MRDRYLELEIEQLPKIAGKPQYAINVKTIANFNSGFGHKLLCDFRTFSLGSACAAKCLYCYVEALVRRHPQVVALREELERKGLDFQDVVITRIDALQILREQLTIRKPRSVDLFDHGVIYTSPLVDPALTLGLARQTAEACRIIFELTNWDVRILTKGNLLRNFVAMVPEEFHQRLILGHSTGTLDDPLAQAIEQNTALVSKRLEDHYWLQEHGFRTFGMVCPSLPNSDPEGFVQEALGKIRADKCEHVWAEVLNIRGDDLRKLIEPLMKGGFSEQVDALEFVGGPGGRLHWEENARNTFLAYTKHLSPDKLRFLQYVRRDTVEWWQNYRALGAVPLGRLVD